MAEPVPHQQDPQRRAPRIRCAVCTACRWHQPAKTDRCLYGGPFEGYDDGE